MVKLNKIEEAISTANKSGPPRLMLIYGPDLGMVNRKISHFATP